jgi:CHRD domain-containing protein
MPKRIILAIASAAIALLLVAAVAVASSGPGRHGAHGDDDAHSGRALFAVLSGRNELDMTTLRRGAGDPDGRGSFTATVEGTQLCFGITVANLDQPVAAHIHRGRRNENGPIVVPLTQPSSGDPGASSGCVTVAAELARAILRHPHRYYANVHTAAFPAGAVRGQLFGHRR